jgi:hypothetical protein
MNLRCTCLLTALLATPLLSVQSQATSSELPSDPAALLSLGHDKNGLDGANIRPWHIHGTYHQYGKKGLVEEAGIYEEWRISPSKYKRMFAGKNFSQIDYADGQGLARAGAQDWPSGPEMLLRETLIDPLPDPAQWKDFQLVKQSMPVGQTALECVAMTYPVRPDLRVNGDTFPTACFDPKIPALRIYSSGSGYRATFDSFVAFQGHYLPKQVRIFTNGELMAELTLDTVEGLKDASDTIVAPPAEAKPVDLSVVELKETGKSRIPRALKLAVPVYPQMAKDSHIEGLVVLHGIVGSDGRPKDLKAVSGPPVLVQPAIDAVAQWIYLPFEVMGEPRTIRMEFKVIFRLG